MCESKLQGLSLSSVLLLIIVVYAPPVFSAVTLDRLLVPYDKDYRLQRIRDHFQNSGDLSPSEAENLASTNSRFNILTSLGIIPSSPQGGLQKKWDSMDGSSFGLQKRSAKSMSDIRNLIQRAVENQQMAWGYQKKWDSLGGGAFGMQKRPAETMSELANVAEGRRLCVTLLGIHYLMWKFLVGTDDKRVHPFCE